MRKLLSSSKYWLNYPDLKRTNGRKVSETCGWIIVFAWIKRGFPDTTTGFTHPNMASQYQNADTILIPPPRLRSHRQAGSPHQSEPRARLWCFSGMFLGELRSGLHALSVCQCGRFKLLCTCSDEGLVVLICVKITKANKETNPPGETTTLRYMWGCAEPPAGSGCLCWRV